jgi:hypothetical protein
MTLERRMIGPLALLAVLLWSPYSLGQTNQPDATAAVAEADTTAPAEPDTTEGEQGIVVVFDTEDQVGSLRDTLLAEDVHPQDAPEERGFLVMTPDGRAKLRIRGSIRLYGAYDFNGLQGRDFFEVFEIPVGEANKTEPRFFMTASQTRFGVEAAVGEAFLKIEGDFRGSPDAANFRVRHAYTEYKLLLVGQTWSVFSDVSAVPLTVEGEGPPNSATERTVQARLRGKLFQGGASWAVAVESPEVDIAVPDTLQLEPAFQSFPDLSARIRKGGDWGHLQLAGLGRSITVREQTGDLSYLAGWGFLGSGTYWTAKAYQILAQIVAGRGVSRYISGVSGRGLDVVWNPDAEQYETVPMVGGSLSLSRDWHPNWFSYLTLGATAVKNKGFQPPDAFSNCVYFAVSLFLERVAGRRVGLEYNFGRRENKGGQSGTANRISFSVVYDF